MGRFRARELAGDRKNLGLTTRRKNRRLAAKKRYVFCSFVTITNNYGWNLPKD